MCYLNIRVSFLCFAACLTAFSVPSTSLASSAGLQPATASAAPARALAGERSGGGRGRVIDFEDSLVEGVNKRPFDSLSQIGEGGRKSRPHLYRKRAGFRTETLETVREIRMAQ